MKIYIAASYPRKEEAKYIGERLKADGHTIVSSWLWKDEGYTSDEWDDESDIQKERRMAAAAVEDLVEVKLCEILVHLTDGEKQLTLGGRHTELGIALGLGKQICIIGARESVFHYHPSIINYDNIDSFLFQSKEMKDRHEN